MPCLGVSSSFLFKFSIKEHSKVAGTKLHSAISCIISLEWEERIWQVNTFELLAQQRQDVNWLFGWYQVSSLYLLIALEISNCFQFGRAFFLCLKSYKQKLLWPLVFYFF